MKKAKDLLTQKKLEEKDKIIVEKDEVITTRNQQLEVKATMLHDLEELVNSLQGQLEENSKVVEELQKSSGDPNTEVTISVCCTFSFVFNIQHFQYLKKVFFNFGVRF